MTVKDMCNSCLRVVEFGTGIGVVDTAEDTHARAIGEAVRHRQDLRTSDETGADPRSMRAARFQALSRNVSGKTDYTDMAGGS